MRWEVRERTDGRKSWDLRREKERKRKGRSGRRGGGREKKSGVGKGFFLGGSEAVEKHGPAGWEESGNERLKLS